MTGENKMPQESLRVVQIVNKPGQRYDLNVAALERVLLRPDLRDIPVVVVSVAGAYRGGKSFILDLFLRYLTASSSNQLSGDWLDTERRQLEGFAWRGGSERHTSGIHLWPEPVIVTRHNGEKVGVLLMDTQGTFDHESTLEDNSTIFALSVLISSIQIYNLIGNIREDDLQKLQLFTEYGRLASDGKALQKLLFLVRDWQHPHEHGYDFDGGEALLNKRLQMKENQMKELRDVRRHIRACFDDIQCFLMPPPGSVIRKQSFEGRVKDLDEEFQTALKELVPSLFDTRYLKPKLISGERVKAKHLLEFFKKYVDIFNSNKLPEPVIIFQATAEARMASVLRDAKDLYNALMEQHFCEDFSVAPGQLRHWHNDAAQAARMLFNNKVILAAQEAVAAMLTQLEEEFDASFSTYNLKNEAKTANIISAAKKVYKDAVNNVCEDQVFLCLHPCDLDVLHEQALSQALELFDKARVRHGQEDEDRNRLERDLKDLFETLSSKNELNNKDAIFKCHELFKNKMKAQLNGAPVSMEVLRTYQDTAMQHAINAFESSRNMPTTETVDEHFNGLIQEIEAIFQEIKLQNLNSNRVIIQSAEDTYKNFMPLEWGPLGSCFHPLALEELHNAGKEKALRQFMIDRPQSQDDEYHQELVEVLTGLTLLPRDGHPVTTINATWSKRRENNNKLIEKRYDELVKMNEMYNSRMVENALAEYTRYMKDQQQPVALDKAMLTGTTPMVMLPMSAFLGPDGEAATVKLSLFGAPVQGKQLKSGPKSSLLSDRHSLGKSAAMKVWQNSRRGGEYAEDPYKEQLNKAIDEACMATVFQEAHDLYLEHMERNFRNDCSVSPSQLLQWHKDATEAAKTFYNNNTNLGSQEAAEATLIRLEEEVVDSFSVYNLKNEAKTAHNFAAAKKVYEDVVNNVCEDKVFLCVHPRDLEILQNRALKSALLYFDKTRVTEGQGDQTRNRLERDLKDLYDNIRLTNEKNNQDAALKCLEMYETNLRALLNGASVSAEVLRGYHDKALQHAIDSFISSRNTVTKEIVDEHLNNLIQDIEARFREFKEQNDNNNGNIIQSSEEIYQSFMSTEWGPQESCFHPLALEELHNTGKEKALENFMTDRPQIDNDEFQQELVQLISGRYEELVRINEVNNKRMVEKAYAAYASQMEEPQPDTYDRMIIKATAPMVMLPVAAFGGPVGLAAAAGLSAYGATVQARQPQSIPLLQRHSFGNIASVNVWNSMRRGADLGDDPYKKELLKAANECFMKCYNNLSEIEKFYYLMEIRRQSEEENQSNNVQLNNLT